ncbi:MAG: hypothetical protein EPN91_03735, partial [Salinibacterium sp.]
MSYRPIEPIPTRVAFTNPHAIAVRVLHEQLGNAADSLVGSLSVAAEPVRANADVVLNAIGDHAILQRQASEGWHAAVTDQQHMSVDAQLEQDALIEGAIGSGTGKTSVNLSGPPDAPQVSLDNPTEPLAVSHAQTLAGR